MSRGIASADSSVSSQTATNNDREIGLTEQADDDDSEFMLRVDDERPRPQAVPLDTAQLAKIVRAELGHSDDDYLLRPAPGTSSVRRTEFESNESRSDRARSSYNDTSGVYPRERHYPTLESMQRMYKIFGYVAILLVFPYISFRILYISFTAKEDLLVQLGEFSETGLPLIFGCVALTATLFAVSEGIKLAIDIQDNTLRIANRHGRKKVD